MTLMACFPVLVWSPGKKEVSQVAFFLAGLVVFDERQVFLGWCYLEMST